MTSPGFLQRFRSQLSRLDKSGNLDWSRSRPVDVSKQATNRRNSHSLRPLIPPIECASPTLLSRHAGTPNSYSSVHRSRRTASYSRNVVISRESYSKELADAYSSPPPIHALRVIPGFPALFKARKPSDVRDYMRSPDYRMRRRLRLKLDL